MKEYLSVREVAERFSISKMSIYRLIEADEIPVLRIGKSLRIRTADLEDYVSSHTTRLEEAE